MTTQNLERTTSDDKAMRTAVSLFGAALVSIIIAALAGIVLVIAEPEAGSSADAILGITAAISGLAVAAFVIGGLIYAQVKNLWRFMPMWLRVAAWIVIGVGVAITLWNLIEAAS
jgi:membrane associated rhomboid family serine protease